MTSGPRGFGYWIGFMSNVSPGPFAADLDAAIELLRKLRASWVAPRAGFDVWQRSVLPERAIADMRAAGLAVFPWIYVRPKAIDAAVASFQQLVDAGADGVIINAEVEWIGMPSAAASLADKLRAALPQTWIAHAPMDQIDLHPKFPWSQIVRGTGIASDPPRLDAVMPQLYAWEHDDSGHAFWQARGERAWKAWEARNPLAAVPRHWIGSCYRPPTRGGRPTSPLPLQRVVDDVVAWRAQWTDDAVASFYTIDAPITYGQADVLRALIDAAPRLAAPAEPQPGVQGRADFVADLVTRLRGTSA